MRRFLPPDLPSRQPRQRGRREPVRREGPFERVLRPQPSRDPAPFIIGGTAFFLALVVLILFVAPFSPLAEDDGEGEEIAVGEADIVARRLREIPPLPPGLIAISPFYAIDVPEEVDGPAVIRVTLLQQERDPTNLGFYTFADEDWRRLTSADLTRDGNEASGEFPLIPKNLVVFRVIPQTYQVVGSLAAGATLHPDAQALVNILSPRDFRPAADGLVEGETTQLELRSGQQLIPTIVGSDPEGAAIVGDILSDGDLRQTHIEAILALVLRGDFDGIDLEYSQVDPELRSAFTLFVEELSQQLHQEGRRLSLTLPAAASDARAGAYDWPALGILVDMIKVLPPPDPDIYWKEMPDVLTFATRNVAPERLFLVMSPFSTRKEGARLDSIGYQQAMLLATQLQVQSPSDLEEIRPTVGVHISAVNIDQEFGASGLHWSDDVRSVIFTFGQEPSSTTVFVENAFSAAFKLELVQAFRLGGVAIADASAEADVANVWPAVKALVDTGAPLLARPDPDVLAPSWLAPDGGDIDASNGSALWRPAEAGQFNIELLVSDGVQRFGRRLNLEVQEEPTPTPTPEPEETPPELEVPTPTPEPTPTVGATPPAQVTGLSVILGGSGQLILTWAPNPEPGVAFYLVYRSEVSGGPYTLIATLPVGTTPYVYADTEVETGIIYYYTVSAVDIDGNEGFLSEEASAVVP